MIFNLGEENERANAGQDGRTCIVRSNPQARTVIIIFSCTAGREQNWQPYRLMNNLLYVITMPTCTCIGSLKASKGFPLHVDRGFDIVHVFQ